MSADIFQTNDLFKFCGDCSAGRSGEEGSWDKSITLNLFFHLTRILSTGSMNWTSKIPYPKPFIYGINVSETVKAVGIEIDQTSR